MIQIKPTIAKEFRCDCGGKFVYSDLIWQGLHVCERFLCKDCEEELIISLPVNQSILEQYSYYPHSGILKDVNQNVVSENWFSSKLKAISSPITEPIELEIDVLKKFDEALVLNTLDYVYGHSLLFLLNLQHILEDKNSLGVIVIVQPQLKWLIPKEGIAEIWTVKMNFNQFNHYYQDLSDKINNQLNRFRTVFLSRGHVIPTNRNIKIETFTGINPYNISYPPLLPRITFIWREDPGRLWIRNILILKGFKKLGFGKILLPFHLFRTMIFMNRIRKMLGSEFRYTVAGLGKYGSFKSIIDDKRILRFNENSERALCVIYSESLLVIGVHGSSMILPSAHAGMTISLMPSKRWGNFAEDILFSENDLRLACFQKRILPLNMSMSDLTDIVHDMVTGRKYFLKKFVHGDDL